MDRLVKSPLWRVKIRENYRQQYDQDMVETISQDMRLNGFKIAYPLQVYAVDDSYFLIDGHTRYHAALLLDNRDFPVWLSLVDQPSDKDFKLSQIQANSLRVDPDDISKAIGYQQAKNAGATIDELVLATGHKRPYIEDRLSLLQLIDQAKDLVAKKQLGIKFAVQLTRLDSNFQRIALQAYIAMKSPTLDEFIAVVNDLYTKQSQCSLFDLAIFSGKPIEEIISSISIERQKTRQELIEEIAALNTARTMDREYAKRKYTAALREIAELKRQLALKKAG